MSVQWLKLMKTCKRFDNLLYESIEAAPPPSTEHPLVLSHFKNLLRHYNNNTLFKQVVSSVFTYRLFYVRIIPKAHTLRLANALQMYGPIQSAAAVVFLLSPPANGRRAFTYIHSQRICRSQCAHHQTLPTCLS